MRNQMHDLAFALDAAANGEHAHGQDDAPLPFNSLNGLQGRDHGASDCGRTPAPTEGLAVSQHPSKLRTDNLRVDDTESALLRKLRCR
jgi:hypothetical protein